ncbi:MAG: hypothetical protein WC655_13885, partial [Candidatus Hydrogenedentales bacterium]
MSVSARPCSSVSPPQPSAPLCPYQLTEYNTVLTDALAIVESQPHPNPMGLHAAHNVAMLQVLVSTAASYMAQCSPWSTAPASPESDAPGNDANFNATNAFFRLMREFRASLKLLGNPAHAPLNRQKQGLTHPTPEGILRHAQRVQHDADLDPDALAGAQLEPQTIQTHARSFVQQAALAGGEGHEVEMYWTYDNAAALDEPFADSQRDHVLASYRPAKQTVSPEIAAEILGNLHLPPLPKSEEDPEKDEGYEHYAQVLQNYLDVFRDGKIPPEGFAKNTPIRAYAESIYTGPPMSEPMSERNSRTDTCEATAGSADVS